MKDEIRIDKWLWAVRLFKTRTLAAEACKKGKVIIENLPAKASRNIKIGEIIQIKKTPVIYSFKVIAFPSSRLGAKLVHEYMTNVTPPDQYEILELSKTSGFIDREKGTGRPTKKDRRALDEFTETEWDF